MAFPVRPPLRRLAVILACGLLLMAGAHLWLVSRRPAEVSGADAATGNAKLARVVNAIRADALSRSPRGAACLAFIDEMVQHKGIRFSPGLPYEALYRKEFGRRPVLYVGVIRMGMGVIRPSDAELAERIFHETIHALKHSDPASWEEECDAFCAAEQAAAAVEKRPAVCLVLRDGANLWDWVRREYPDHVSDPAYVPVSATRTELETWAEIPAVR